VIADFESFSHLILPNAQLRYPVQQIADEGGRRAALHHLQSPDAAPVHVAIATGLSKRAVAERFGVWGHAQAHLTAEIRAALATKLLQREADTQRSALSLDAKFAPDSPLEGARFEPSVPG